MTRTGNAGLTNKSSPIVHAKQPKTQSQKDTLAKRNNLQKVFAEAKELGYLAALDPFLQDNDIVAAISNPKNGDALLLTKADVNLAARYGINWLFDPYGESDSRPRWQRGEANWLRKYAEATLGNLVFEVSTAPEGSRNQTLNKAAFALGGLLGWDVLDANVVLDALVSAALDSGLNYREAKSTATSAMRRGQQHPRDIPEPKSKPRPHTRQSRLAERWRYA